MSHSVSNINTRDDALTAAIYYVRPNLKQQNKKAPWSWYDEPRWLEPSTLLAVMSHIQASNLAAVQAALSGQTTFFTDCIRFRNFYAHRSETTVKPAQALATGYGLSPQLHPSELLCSLAQGRPQNVLADWMDDLVATIELTK